ncbi:type II toxin-antitoxin system RelE/ParE family toxin [Nitrospina watsonii]|uniref:Killer suppression protein HigA n=1 Tax=Nitrospina watsonii TaxID=1323948 RepID=A0ABN8W2H8_9BACT|nr:type II toxin-antitoxin system RelE/ParE family toxin [Nitrospina watsonii]CAI2719372.1 conserved protein of unknown function [Nitrospina watsonii]
MEISFSKKPLQKTCGSEKESNKKWGRATAKRVRQRLAELAAADTLSDMSHLPPARCHELTGKRKGLFAVNVSAKMRLIFKPDHSPVPENKHGGIDLNKITKITILEVADYHGE